MIKKNKKNVLNTAKNLYDGRELVVNTFKSGLFPLKSTTGTGLKILTPKQLLQRLAITLAQVKAGNISESLLNQIRQIFSSFYQSKEITKKVSHNIIRVNTIIKMDTKFMNSESSKTCESYVLILKPTDKLDLRRDEKSIALLNLSIYYT